MNSLLTEDDLYLFNEGTHLALYEKLGSHPCTIGGKTGVFFAVWAPNAESVHVMGDFNGWSKSQHPMKPRGSSGIWETFLPDVGSGARYKFFVASRLNGYRVDKTDPFAFHNEIPPRTASIVCDLAYQWQDGDWMAGRWRHNGLGAPISIYEMHLGSWGKLSPEYGRHPTYRELAAPLVEYLRKMNFTHVEFLPVMEHPFYGSWGYQSTGYFAPTSRHGTPQDLMYLIDCLHRNGIGVILDWVPSHFTTDEHGLGYFDGTHLFEHSDRRQGWHPDWDSYVFNYGRTEVREFLLNSALFWLDKYHIDGLRVDAVASMLYLDYSRKEGEWIPNRFGGRENLDAIDFLRNMNTQIYAKHPDVITIAEESTAWPMVSRPLYVGGLGFGAKWDMGWMHDTLEYVSQDPVYRKYRHDQITFRMVYAFSENYVLPLSHDEVVHGKGSLLSKMPGDWWQKFANLKTLYGYMWAQPGKKLLFMGGEFGQWREWNHDLTLDWNLLDFSTHSGLLRWVEDLNRMYRDDPALHEYDCHHNGFQWIDCHDSQQSVLSFLRKGKTTDHEVLAVFNFTPVPRGGYRLGVPKPGFWKEILNSDAEIYNGTGWGNSGGVQATAFPSHGQPYSLELTLPPLSAVFLRSDVTAGEKRPEPEPD
ncbi:MAG: 1,4-alpha-glucan branching protein GlgB [Pirellulaceae bacterium]|nr:1,4-alpha-glucan branching protein GlgB [Pirellulaceae bacterium]